MPSWPGLAFSCIKGHEPRDRKLAEAWHELVKLVDQVGPALDRCYGVPSLSLAGTALVGSSATFL